MDDERLEEFIERLEKLYEDMSNRHKDMLDRLTKLEEQVGNPANPPIGLSTPMVAYATKPPVGFVAYPDSLPMHPVPRL